MAFLYQFHPEQETEEEARLICEGEGARLPRVRSQGSRDLLDEFYADYGVGLWLGLYNVGSASDCTGAACDDLLNWGDGGKFAFDSSFHGRVKAVSGLECFRFMNFNGTNNDFDLLSVYCNERRSFVCQLEDSSSTTSTSSTSNLALTTSTATNVNIRSTTSTTTISSSAATTYTATASTTSPQASTTKPPLPSGDKPTFAHWRKYVTEDKDKSDEYPRYCVAECKSNCTNDGNHKCFGKFLQGKLETVKIFKESWKSNLPVLNFQPSPSARH